MKSQSISGSKAYNLPNFDLSVVGACLLSNYCKWVDLSFFLMLAFMAMSHMVFLMFVGKFLNFSIYPCIAYDNIYSFVGTVGELDVRIEGCCILVFLS